MTLGVSSSFSDNSINLYDRASVESVQMYIMLLPTKAREYRLQFTKINVFTWAVRKKTSIGDRSYGTIECYDWTLLFILVQTKNAATSSFDCRLYFYTTSVEISFPSKNQYFKRVGLNTLSHLLDLQEMFYALIWPLVKKQINCFLIVYPIATNLRQNRSEILVYRTVIQNQHSNV